jgi:diguanylate cyclase (GGDEF)-like protein
MSKFLDDEADQALQDTLARYKALLRVARNLAELENLKPLLQTIADVAANMLGANLVTIHSFDLVRRKVELIVRSGPSASDPLLDEAIPDSSPAWALESWRPQARSVSEQHPWPGSHGEPIPWTTITAPIIYAERILGILKASNPADHSPFTQADETLLTALSNLAALAIESDRLRRTERQQRRQAETLREVARILNYSLDQQHVLELILDQLARVVEYDSASIMLVADQQVRMVAHRKLRYTEQMNIPDHIQAYPHILEVLERRRPVIIEDTHQDSRWQSLPQASYIRCWLGVPLIGRDQVIGLLNLDNEQPGYYSQPDAALAATFASQAAIAIENARLYTAERMRVDQLNALRATVADISAELELPRLLQAILQRAVKLLNATGGDLGLLDENRGEILILASHNMGKDYTGTRMQIGEGAMGQAVQNRRPVLVEDYARWENASPQYREGRWHAVLAVPFLIGKRIAGALGVVDEDPLRRFTASDQHLISLFAQHAAIAVENARLYQAAREAADRRATLHQVSQAIVAASLEPEEIYAAIHQAAARLMPAEAFVIVRYEEESQLCHAVYLVDRSGRVPTQTASANSGLSAQVISAGRSLYIPDTLSSELTKEVTHFGDPALVRSVLAVPMRLRGKVVGMLSTQSYRPNAYSTEDPILLEMLAAYAAIALDNASLFQSIQQLAITDSLTGIFNRRHLFELGQREFQRAKRFKRPLSVLMIDIDRFKSVNDRFSHSIGDAVLKQLADLLKNSLREFDIVGRYGGEEFVIVLPETGLTAAVEIAERLRLQINTTFKTSSLPPITVSIGAASIQADTPDLETLIHYADNAMYQAKNSGGDQVEFDHQQIESA